MRLLLFALLFAAGSAPAQPAFDAASVKPNTTGSSSSHSNSRPDNIEMTNVPLRRIIMRAYNLKEYQVVGPSWLDSERYDVQAKAAFGTPKEQLPAMLVTLLVERFKLQTHRDTRDFPVYGLVIAKGGLKLKQVEAGGSGMNSNRNDAGGELTATKTTMAGFAEWLSRQMDRPVIDMTGNSGSYDFTLKYSREDAKAESPTVTYPVITLAIQDQLGVRLEKRTAPIEILVIDHAEKVPVEN